MVLESPPNGPGIPPNSLAGENYAQNQHLDDKIAIYDYILSHTQ